MTPVEMLNAALAEAFKGDPANAVRAHAAMLPLIQKLCPDFSPTLPRPAHVYLTDKSEKAIVVGDPQQGWNEESEDAHNCDAAGCGQAHVLFRLPFTDERTITAKGPKSLFEIATGWAVVPRVLTPEMDRAAAEREDDEPLSDWGKIQRAPLQAIWEALLKASPDPNKAINIVAGERASKLEAKCVLRDLLNHLDANTCLHETTHRGGSIWTICDDCDAKWADDKGGFKPHQDEPAVAAARAYLKGLEDA